MKLCNKSVKRAGIYFFFDKDGVVDDYNIYFLNDIKKNIDFLLVVVNGILNCEGESKLNAVADEVFVRENIGFDVWAYKTSLGHIGWDKLNTYDEVLLMNYTNFGPVYPFSEMFKEMDQRDLDFWGITKHNGHSFDPYNLCEYGYIPAHIQSSFIGVRRSMFNTDDFRRYWEDMPMVNKYEESICFHEAVFTEKFKSLGYKESVYVDTEDMKDYCDYPLMICAKKLIQEKRCPIFKRKTFFNIYEEFMDLGYGESGIELYNFLLCHTDYDINMIWDNILRTANMYDIKQRMQLNYILPTDIVKQRLRHQPRVALFMHIYHMDMLQECRSYADNMPTYADIYVSTSSQGKKAVIEKEFASLGRRKVTVVYVENRGREYTGFYIGLKPYYRQYDYICIAHSKKPRYDKPYIIGDSFAYHCFENTLSSKDFTENVILTFEENPRLGLLVPPTPDHATYYSTIGREWRGNFRQTKETAAKWGIKVDINETKPPVAPLGGFLWFRSCALSLLFEQNFSYEDFPEEPCNQQDGTVMHVIERIYPFVAQQAGYYSGWLMSDKFASLQVTNHYKTIRDFNEIIFWCFGEDTRHGTLNNLCRAISQSQKPLTLKERIRRIAQLLLGTRIFNKLNWARKKLLRKK